MRLRLVIFVAALACACAATPVEADAADPGPSVRRSMFGLTGWAWPERHDLSRVTRRRLRLWRQTLPWAEVEPTRGRYSWSGYDTLVARLVRRRVSILFVLSACPAWACHRGGLGPPRTSAARSAWRAFADAAVRRYGSRGTFWQAHPHLPRLPVVHWQILNEINGSAQWPHPSAAGYAALLKGTAAAVRGADSSSRIVLGGLGEKMTIWLRDYLPALYRQPGFARDFDVMAAEGYAPRPRDVARIMRTTRRIMGRFHDSAKPVWITEMSWATGGGPHAFVTTRRGQARRLRRAYDVLLACRERWNLQRIYWFGFRDRRRPPGEADYWGNHNGLISLGARWKPAMRSFLGYLRTKLTRGHRTTCRRALAAARR